MVETGSRFLEELYERHRRLMYATALKFVSDQRAAEDIVHDAVVKLLEKEDTLRTLSCCTLTSYVVYTVRNTAVSHLRRQDVRKKHRVETESDWEAEDAAPGAHPASSAALIRRDSAPTSSPSNRILSGAALTTVPIKTGEGSATCLAAAPMLRAIRPAFSSNVFT